MDTGQRSEKGHLMKKIVFLAAAVMLAPLAASPVLADTAASAPKAAYTTSDTDLGTLLDNPATKAVLVKDLPELVANPQIDMARSMTLKQMQAYAGDKLTDAKLAEVDVDLSKVPAAK